jgi:hypothetical protein
MIALIFMVVWAFLLTTALLWGFYYDWPDFAHVNYGLPLTWGTHTLSTITGAVNIWEVSVSNLLVDLIFWLATHVISRVTASLQTQRIIRAGIVYYAGNGTWNIKDGNM